MKKFIASFAVCVCLALSLAGCGGVSSQSASLSSPSSAVMQANDVSASSSSSQAEAAKASSEAAPAASASSSSAAPQPEPEPQQPANSGAVMLSGFVPLSQYPELQNGCEVTTLAAVLNYQGIPADKGDLSDNYLPKKPVGQANYYREFVGNPRDADAYGCYAPVIVTTANSYLSSNGFGGSATDLTGTPLRSLFPYVQQGKPVMVWGTQYNQPGYFTVTWQVDGQSLTWFRPEHCMALVGYDLAKNLVYVSDPMEGAILSYDIDAFESNYNDLHQQAIVIS